MLAQLLRQTSFILREIEHLVHVFPIVLIAFVYLLVLSLCASGSLLFSFVLELTGKEGMGFPQQQSFETEVSSVSPHPKRIIKLTGLSQPYYP